MTCWPDQTRASQERKKEVNSWEIQESLFLPAKQASKQRSVSLQSVWIEHNIQATEINRMNFFFFFFNHACHRFLSDSRRVGASVVVRPPTRPPEKQNRTSDWLIRKLEKACCCCCCFCLFLQPNLAFTYNSLPSRNYQYLSRSSDPISDFFFFLFSDQMRPATTTDGLNKKNKKKVKWRHCGCHEGAINVPFIDLHSHFQE